MVPSVLFEKHSLIVQCLGRGVQPHVAELLRLSVQSGRDYEVLQEKSNGQILLHIACLALLEGLLRTSNGSVKMYCVSPMHPFFTEAVH